MAGRARGRGGGGSGLWGGMGGAGVGEGRGYKWIEFVDRSGSIFGQGTRNVRAGVSYG
jgi:hypothetical protein